MEIFRIPKPKKARMSKSKFDINGIEKRPQLWSDGWLLYQDDAPAHTALSVKQFLTSKNITVMGHPPYSPDLDPCDFFLFPKVIFCFKGIHFTSVEEVQAKTENLPKEFPKTSFQNCYQNAEGDYFEDISLFLTT
ncbi:uncharacterized protein LOC143264822 isoform X1 [Megachile rotundata]|uniref:uncharacterized protein LOC143264822 isoform X1 n=1 Tax=Megachile rotundata TaxID=143995 RepID=UPI003FD1B9D5